VFDSNLNYINSFGDNFLIFPSDIAVDLSGNIYVADRGLSIGQANNPKVLVFDKNFKLITTFGSFRIVPYLYQMAHF